MIPNEYASAENFGEGRVGLHEHTIDERCCIDHAALGLGQGIAWLSSPFFILMHAFAMQIKAYDLKQGQEMVGTINRCMLFHGAQVDIGAEYDA